MAVVQISQIQVRRGFFEDIGQLAGGEFGWAHDQLRLFIGNGTVGEGAPYEGNTEILTQHSLKTLIGTLFPYTFKGILGGYEAQTGADILVPVVRTLQDKLDDIVNVKDFGAKGDGATNDIAAIQRAIDQIYDRLASYTDYVTRRVIDFYPGVYVISGELRIPPYCTLRGTTRDGVIIYNISPVATCSIKTTNSIGNADNTLTAGGVPPGDIIFENITFQNSSDITIARLESVHDVKFVGCKFIGHRLGPSTVTNSAGAFIASTYLPTRNVHFEDCDFNGFTLGANIAETAGTQGITFDKCTFSNLYQGITANGLGANIAAIRITNSVFDKIHSEAIRVENFRGVTSGMNTFLANVGVSYGNTITNNVIKFGGNLSYSLGDVFLRNQDNDATVSTVEHAYPEVVSTDTANAVKYGYTYQTLGKSIIVQNNTVNYVPLNPRFRTGIVHYSVQRGTKYRSGTIHFSADAATNTCDWRDSYSEKTPTGITVQVDFNASLGTARPILVYTSDNSGNPSAITYDVKSNTYNTIV